MGMRVAVWLGAALVMAVGACSHVLYQLHAERERTEAVMEKVAALHAQVEALQGRSPELAKQDTGRGKSREGSNP
ncbi:MAG TPA: hypothetical protein VJT80_23220 [Steroidobacteraceae bacterium]|jgi:hypothetical protein|nr:hypothetical protein [Steroidobacteraceae bacterium]